MSISIIIVSHGHEDDVLALLASIAKNFTQEVQIVLVDNIGGGAAFGDLRARFGLDVVLVRNIRPLSFAKNNNLGASASSGDILLFLNPDTLVADGALSNWLEGSEVRADTLYFPQLLNFDGTPQVHGKKKPSLLDQGVTFLASRAGLRRSSPPGNYWYFAAALAVRRATFAALGGFDENFPMYGEDTELCDRSRKCGLNLEVVKDAPVLHRLGDNSKNKYIWKAVISGMYYRLKSAYNIFAGRQLRRKIDQSIVAERSRRL